MPPPVLGGPWTEIHSRIPAGTTPKGHFMIMIGLYSTAGDVWLSLCVQCSQGQGSLQLFIFTCCAISLQQEHAVCLSWQQSHRVNMFSIWTSNLFK